MTSDIVARLRRAEWYCNKSEEHMGYCNRKCARRNLPNPDECQEAADEIERLREELTASHESHGNEVGALTERLSLAIHERDEARRDRCMARAVIRWDIEHPNSPQRSQTTIILLAWQIADEEGWDCFKEATDER